MYEEMLGEKTAWRYGIPGILCGDTIGTNREGHACLAGKSTLFLESVTTLVEYNLKHMTQLKRLRSCSLTPSY
jgi:hypothetical protein